MIKKLLSTSFLLMLLVNFATAQINSIGLIGTATPDEWTRDTNMVQDPMNPDLWTMTIDLKTGEAKFRANDEWIIDWGADAFPSGVGEQGGANIPVAGGPTIVTFNSATGAYNFESTAPTFDTIGLIGTATPIGNFTDDVDMVKDSLVPWVWTLEVALGMGDAKFRANDAWTINWGGDTLVGVGVQGGGNVPIVDPADYKVTFNTASFEYSFEKLTPEYNTIGLIGEATVGSDTVDTDLIKNPNNASLWSANMTLTDGWAKFRAEDDWTINWGIDSFPSGTAVMGGPNIPVVAGEYNVKFNSTTGEFSFDDPKRIFSTIGVIGTGTALEFARDIDMIVDAAEPDQWSLQLKLQDGSIKFRADNDWNVNWGDDGFPTGTGTQGGPDIPVFEGDWELRLNATSGVYSFTPVTVGLVGEGTSLASWDVDVDMTLSDTLGNYWTLMDQAIDGNVKFRKDDDWDVNWGADDLVDTGTQDGPNINVPAGTYNVAINTGTGDYSFTLASGTSTQEVLNPNAVKVFPNPANHTLNISVENDVLKRNVSIRLLDATGRILVDQKYNTLDNLTMDVSNYASGIYFLHISTNEYILGKRFTVAK